MTRITSALVGRVATAGTSTSPWAGTSILPALPTRPTEVNLHAAVVTEGAGTGQVIDGNARYLAVATYGMFGVFSGSTLVNRGVIWDEPNFASPNVSAVYGTSAGDISNYGTIVIDRPHPGESVAINVGGWSENRSTIANIGSITAYASNGDAWGIHITEYGHTVLNDGIIAVRAQTSPDTPDYVPGWWPRWDGNGRGLDFREGQTRFVNGVAGQVLVEADQAYGVRARGSLMGTTHNDIENHGLIHAVSTDEGALSVGLLLVNTTNQQMRVVNTGTIIADQAILGLSSGYEGEYYSIQYNAQTITNSETGVIRGSIELRNGNDMLTNSGRIYGMVDMGPDNDRFDNRLGTIEGRVYLGQGNDRFDGGAGAEFVNGERDDDLIDGGAGNDLLLGADGNDVLIGGTGNDGLYGGYGNDVLRMAGGDEAFGGHGDDRFELSDLSFRRIDGGAGTDTLVLPAQATTLNLSAVVSSGRVTSIEHIALGTTGGVVVRASDIAALTGGTILRISGDSGARIDLVGTWVEGASQVIDGVNYRSLTRDGATVLVQASATTRVDPATPLVGDPLGPITGEAPLRPGAETGLYDDSLTLVTDSYELDVYQALTLTIESHELWISADGQAVVSGNAQGSLVNHGTVYSEGVGRVTASVSLYDGQLINRGEITAENLGEGLARALLIGSLGNSGGSINSGEIAAFAWRGDAIAAHLYSGDQPNGNEIQFAFTTSGTLSAYSEYGFATGFIFHNPGSTISNSGLIIADGGQGSIAVDFGTSGGNLINSGEVRAISAPGSEYYSIGVLTRDFATIQNSGLISAEIAILITLPQYAVVELANTASGRIEGDIVQVVDDQGYTYGLLELSNAGIIAGSIVFDPLTQTRDTIVNTGVIQGNVRLGGANDVFDGAGGTQSGRVEGGDGDDRLTGGAATDVLDGGSGDDELNGGGGADTLHGGAGNDIFHVDRQGDLVFEYAGEGTDTVISSGSFYLYANIENLTLTGSADLFGVGNELANTILGNSGSNLLLGGGGNDVIRGGAGVDSLFGESGADQLFGDAGIDYLVGGIGNDTLDGGADADSLYGEDGDDVLIGGTSFHTDILVGGAGNDTLRGNSGLGDYDLMDGGAGNDSYYVDTPDDLTFEAVNGGTDTVYATINGAGYYLYANVENLVLGGNTPFGVGNGLDNRITGSAASNWLLGGAGNDVLNGRSGNDVLFGEAGADIFVFERGTGADAIGDFVAGTDRIDLSAFGFTSFAQVQAVIGENGGTSFIALGGADIVVLNGVAMSMLDADDFILTAPAPAATDVPVDPASYRADPTDMFERTISLNGARLIDAVIAEPLF